MKIRTCILTGAILCTTFVHAQIGTGALFDPGYKPSLMKGSSLGYTGTLPSSYSMKSYTPYAKNQGNYGTCVGWATAYAALTTEYAKSIGLTNRNEITGLSFCPYFVYNQGTGDNTCMNGMQAPDAIILLRDVGAKKFYMPVIGCGSTVNEQVMDDANEFHIHDGYVLYNPSDGWDDSISDPVQQLTTFLTTKTKPDIESIKEVLASGDPVIFVTFVPMSFFNVTSDTWEPTPDEKENPGKYVLDNTGLHQQHAMCIIGYDDNRNGGSFEIMNSWGETWGDDGFTWVKYDDWGLFAYGAYYMELNPANPKEMAGTGAIFGDCQNGYGVYKFADGSRYEGHFKNGLYDGEGIYTWPSGLVYAGTWVNGKRQGEGTQYLPNGDYGSCVYDNDVQVGGYAEWNYTNGDSYDGNLNADKQRSGYGIYKFTNGGSYEGGWVANNRSGLGTMHWSNGDMYYGEWSDDDMNGMGVLIKSDGSIMAGAFSYGNFTGGHSGYGYADQQTLDKLKKVVPGTAGRNYQTADCQSGDCVYGKGYRKYSNGMNYEGQFKDGVEDGEGTMYMSDGSKFVGFFKQGKMNGVGRWDQTDGTKYIVNYKDEKIDGYALAYTGDGYILLQEYSDGTYIRDVSDWTSTASTLNYADKYGSNPNATKPVNMPGK